MSLSLDDALTLRERLRAEGKTLVFTNGHFDLLHVGHLDYLEKARALGGALIVGLNGDQSSERLKGTGRPIVPDYERARLLSALRCVDGVVLFYDDTAHTLIDALRPDIYVKGGDYHDKPLPERELVESYGGQVVLIDLLPGHSTSELIRRVRALPTQPFDNLKQPAGQVRIPLPTVDELVLPPANPLYPWHSPKKAKTYYAVSQPGEGYPALQWPIRFNARYLLMPIPAITYALCLVLTVIYFVGIFTTISTTGQTLLVQHFVNNGLNTTNVLLNGQYHRLLTYSLLHLNGVHLFSNLFVLWLLGRRLEPQFGIPRYLLLVVGSTLLTGIAWVIFTPSRFLISVGASATVYALIGATLVHIWVNRRALGVEASQHRNRLLIVIFSLFALDISANMLATGAGPTIDIAAHVYGLIFGALIAWMVAPRMAFRLSSFDGKHAHVDVIDTNRRRWWPVGVIGLLVILGLIIFEFIKRDRWMSLFG